MAGLSSVMASSIAADLESVRSDVSAAPFYRLRRQAGAQDSGHGLREDDVSEEIEFEAPKVPIKSFRSTRGEDVFYSPQADSGAPAEASFDIKDLSLSSPERASKRKRPQKAQGKFPPGSYPLWFLQPDEIDLYCLARIGRGNKFCMELVDDCKFRRTHEKNKLPLAGGRYYIDVSDDSGSGARIGLAEPSVELMAMASTSTGQAHVETCQSVPVWANIFVTVDSEWEQVKSGEIEEDSEGGLPEEFVSNLAASATPNPKKRVRFSPGLDPGALSEDLLHYHEQMKPFYESLVDTVNTLSSQANYLLTTVGKPSPRQLAPTLWAAAEDLEARLAPAETDLDVLGAGVDSLMDRSRAWDQTSAVVLSLDESVRVLDENIRKVHAFA